MKSSENLSYQGVGKAEIRLLDEVADKEFLEKMKDTKNKISSKIKSKVNFGYADVRIDGIEKTDFYAHSRVNDLESFQKLYKVDDTVIDRMSDISLEPQEKIFKTLKVNSANEIDEVNGWDRVIDSESKILHDLAKRLGDKKSASGRIKIYTDWNCCPSCKSVIEQFNKKYPKIKIEVIYKKSK